MIHTLSLGENTESTTSQGKMNQKRLARFSQIQAARKRPKNSPPFRAFRALVKANNAGLFTTVRSRRLTREEKDALIIEMRKGKH